MEHNNIRRYHGVLTITKEINILKREAFKPPRLYLLNVSNVHIPSWLAANIHSRNTMHVHFFDVILC